MKAGQDVIALVAFLCSGAACPGDMHISGWDGRDHSCKVWLKSTSSLTFESKMRLFYFTPGGHLVQQKATC
jgi:hypothetical protein